MKNTRFKYKALTAIVSYAAIFLAAAVFLTSYLVSAIISDSDKIQAQILDREIEKARMGQLPQMEEDWKNFEFKKDSLDVILNPENEIGFMENIESIADKTGNIIANLKIEDNDVSQVTEKNKKPASKNKNGSESIMDKISFEDYFPMQINLRGDYNGLVNFINMLENSPIYINVISIQTRKELVEISSQDTMGAGLIENNPDKSEKKEELNSVINAVVYAKY